LNNNPKLIEIPCHRVVRNNGKIGGYKLGAKKKIEFLKKDGIKIKDNRVIDSNKVLEQFGG
jgi:methylated-DNA-[protein]-cysteine S-methyltransferase